jgi:purine-binding chemotaxis protein CheW
VGLVVDTVSDVLNIPNDAIADPPELTTSRESSCITGMGKLGERIVMLLDTGRLVGATGEILEEAVA